MIKFCVSVFTGRKFLISVPFMSVLRGIVFLSALCYFAVKWCHLISYISSEHTVLWMN